jgi:membrane associated rhomboid family serine protease
VQRCAPVEIEMGLLEDLPIGEVEEEVVREADEGHVVAVLVAATADGDARLRPVVPKGEQGAVGVDASPTRRDLLEAKGDRPVTKGVPIEASARAGGGQPESDGSVVPSKRTAPEHVPANASTTLRKKTGIGVRRPGGGSTFATPHVIPIRDINPTRTVPFVNYTLIVVNVVVYLGFSTLPPWYDAGYGLVPVRLTQDPAGEFFTILTSMFMHANLVHLGGNLLFLHIFGDNVEDALGHGRYVAFYLLSGLGAGLAQVTVDPASTIPMVGASGAIAGVTAAYVLLYPRAPIAVLNPILPLWLFLGPTLIIPAWFVAAEFFVMNLFMGLQSLGMHSQGGVAFFAHLGGFVAGAVLLRPMRRGRRRVRRDAWAGWRPPPRGPGAGGGSGHRRDPWVPPRR